MQRVERHLDWPDCQNVRDLGGLPTADGGLTRRGALVRADDLCRLTPTGRRRLADFGVRTILDLRGPAESADPHPFAAHPLVGYRGLSLRDPDDGDTAAALDAAGADVPTIYRVQLERCAPRFAEVLRAFATAPPGGVLIHCHAGKDRTGLAVALLLALADVAPRAIVEDYALSADRLRAAPWLRRPDLIARADTMWSTLDWLSTARGGARAYALAAGLEPATLDQLRARLR
jgi:hypothetical protein